MIDYCWAADIGCTGWYLTVAASYTLPSERETLTCGAGQRRKAAAQVRGTAADMPHGEKNVLPACLICFALLCRVMTPNREKSPEKRERECDCCVVRREQRGRESKRENEKEQEREREREREIKFLQELEGLIFSISVHRAAGFP